MIPILIQKALADAPVIAPIGAPDVAVSATAVVNNAYTSILTLLLLIAGGLAVLYTIWYGIQYITSAGLPDKAKAARTGIINGVIGVVIVVAAYAIVRFGIIVGNWIATSLK